MSWQLSWCVAISLAIVVSVLPELRAPKLFETSSSFRPGQMKAVLSVLHGCDAFARMATGLEKSMYSYIPVLSSYQLSMGIIISPLVGLMDQQV